jgi:hypothetical protein
MVWARERIIPTERPPVYTRIYIYIFVNNIFYCAVDAEEAELYSATDQNKIL